VGETEVKIKYFSFDFVIVVLKKEEHFKHCKAMLVVVAVVIF